MPYVARRLAALRTEVNVSVRREVATARRTVADDLDRLDLQGGALGGDLERQRQRLRLDAGQLADAERQAVDPRRAVATGRLQGQRDDLRHQADLMHVAPLPGQ